MRKVTGAMIIKALEEERVDRKTIKQFLLWLKKHKCMQLAFERGAVAVARHKPFFGAKAIAEEVRYNPDVYRISEFKVCNTWVAYLARVLLLKHPEFKGRIQTKPLRGVNCED